MRKFLKVAAVLLFLCCVAAITLGIGIYCVNTFSFGGRSAEWMAKEPMYYYYEPLVDDYISSLVSGRPVVALSCVEPNLLSYYSSLYKTNSDIVMTLDDRYAHEGYSQVTGWYIHHTIEWNPGVYSDTLDKLSTSADRGIDLYVRLSEEDRDEESTLILEVIQRDGFWYLLSVIPYDE